MARARKTLAFGMEHKSGIDDDGKSRSDHATRQFFQSCIGAACCILAVDIRIELRLAVGQRRQSEQPLALDIRTDADRAQPLQRDLREGALAATRQSLGDDHRRTAACQAAMRQAQITAAGFQFMSCFAAPRWLARIAAILARTIAR